MIFLCYNKSMKEKIPVPSESGEEQVELFDEDKITDAKKEAQERQAELFKKGELEDPDREDMKEVLKFVTEADARMKAEKKRKQGRKSRKTA